ncbi:hypothetical protein [Lacinutrix cladophorae]
MNPNTNITEKEFENIERYLSGSMSPEARKALELKLKNNSALLHYFNEHKIMQEAIETQSLKEQLDIYHSGISADKTLKNNHIKVISFPFKKMIAAAVLIIALGSFWFINLSSNNEKLYTQYFKADPGLPTTMGETNNYDFYNAMVNYKQGDYTLAISKWEKLLNTKPKNDTLNYFIGVAHLANKNEKKAILYLSKVTNNTLGSFTNEAYYYLGLAHLKADNMELAKKNLTFSTIDNSKKILSKLNN